MKYTFHDAMRMPADRMLHMINCHQDLIDAAQSALVQLKHNHDSRWQHFCPGIEHCPTAAAIAKLEAEIAKAKATPPPLTLNDPQSPDFHATGPFSIEDVTPKMVNPPPATIDTGDTHIATQILDAAAAIEVRPSFMPGTRICSECEAPLPSTTHAAVTRCGRCMA